MREGGKEKLAGCVTLGYTTIGKKDISDFIEIVISITLINLNSKDTKKKLKHRKVSYHIFENYIF